MATDTKAVTHNVVEQLGVLITHAMTSRAYHSWNPSHSADEDEAKIRLYASRVAQLRKLREDFEDLMFGEIHE
jgi:hypothetical protein